MALTCYQSDFDRGIYDRFKRFLYPDLLHPLDRGRFLLVSNWTYAQTDPWAQIVDIREKTGPDLNAVTDGSLVVRLHHKPERQ